jgi:hypothetical protein
MNLLRYIVLILLVFFVHLLPSFIILHEISDNSIGCGESYEAWMSIMMVLDFPISCLLLILMYFCDINVLFHNNLILVLIIQILGTINWTILILTVMHMNPAKRRVFFLCFYISLAVGIITLIIDFLFNMDFSIVLCTVIFTLSVLFGIYSGFVIVCLLSLSNKLE